MPTDARQSPYKESREFRLFTVILAGHIVKSGQQSEQVTDIAEEDGNILGVQKFLVAVAGVGFLIDTEQRHDLRLCLGHFLIVGSQPHLMAEVVEQSFNGLVDALLVVNLLVELGTGGFPREVPQSLLGFGGKVVERFQQSKEGAAVHEEQRHVLWYQNFLALRVAVGFIDPHQRNHLCLRLGHPHVVAFQIDLFAEMLHQLLRLLIDALLTF